MTETAPSLVVNADCPISPLRRKGDPLADTARMMETLHRSDRAGRVRAAIPTWTAPAVALACGLLVFGLGALQLAPRFLLRIHAALNWLSAS